MKKILLLSLLLTSCAKEELVTERVTQSTNTVYEQSSVVMDENEFRQKNGQALLSQGLSCSLHPVANTTTTIPNSLPSSVASFSLTLSFNQPNESTNNGLNILPTALRNVHKTFFIVRCTGFIAVEISDYYSFELTSDDGSMLYLNNALLINNNGLHAVQTVSGSKMLKRGLHQFRLDYFQASGNQALILKSGGQIVSGSLFYR